MKYSTFVTALKEKNWPVFHGVHFIIPPALCEDISYVQTPFYHTFCVQIIHRSSKYGLQDITKHQMFYHNLMTLEQHVRLIPSSMEICHHTRKTPLVRVLDHISSQITSTTRPSTHLHIPRFCTIRSLRKDHVFKQSHSAGFQHVIVPKGNAAGNEIDPDFNILDKARWFLQEEVPLLKKFECRVGICLQRQEKVIFRKWTDFDSRCNPAVETVWNWEEVGALINISTLR